MKRQFTFQQYRMIDLGLFAVMLLIFEYIIVSAATKWFPGQPFTVSVVAAVTGIVMMRWGYWGGIHAALGGIFFCMFSGAEPEQYLIYGLGNLLSVLAVLFIRWQGDRKIRTTPLLSLVYAAGTQVLMQLGRIAVAVVLGHSFRNCLGFITTDALSILFTMVIIWVVRSLDGLFEDQKTYLLRLQEEREKERGE